MSSTGSMKWNFTFSFFISFVPLFIEFKACKGNFTNVGKRYAHKALIRPSKFNIGYWTRGLQLLCCWPVKHWQFSYQVSFHLRVISQLLALQRQRQIGPNKWQSPASFTHQASHQRCYQLTVWWAQNSVPLFIYLFIFCPLDLCVTESILR